MELSTFRRMLTEPLPLLVVPPYEVRLALVEPTSLDTADTTAINICHLPVAIIMLAAPSLIHA